MQRKAAPTPTLVPNGDDSRQIINAQGSADSVLHALNALPFYAADGALVSGQSFGAGATVGVKHLLGRVPQGFLVLRPRLSGPLLWQVSAADKYTIPIRHDGAATTQVDLWFY